MQIIKLVTNISYTIKFSWILHAYNKKMKTNIRLIKKRQKPDSKGKNEQIKLGFAVLSILFVYKKLCKFCHPPPLFKNDA